jgi:hypothetical protein
MSFTETIAAVSALKEQLSLKEEDTELTKIITDVGTKNPYLQEGLLKMLRRAMEEGYYENIQPILKTLSAQLVKIQPAPFSYPMSYSNVKPPPKPTGDDSTGLPF